MKHYKIISVLAIPLIYLMFSFIPWQFNPRDWTLELRGGFILCLLMFEITLFGYKKIMGIDKE